jgi:glycine/D-amino acid oxidase-like deaminating enzyme
VAASLATLHSPIAICGAGIAGIAAAYWLAVKHGRPVTLIDERPPLSLTSDKSTEAYRNWWPGPGDAMVRLMNRSLDLLEEWARATGDRFHLNRRGYAYATADVNRLPEVIRNAQAISALGAGELRLHPSPSVSLPPSPFGRGAGGEGEAYHPHAADDWEGQPDGADLLLDPALIRAHFPYLSERTVAVLHVRRAGWFSAQQLGMWLLEQARECGVKVVTGRVVAVETDAAGVCAVRLMNGDRLPTRCFVNAAGPFVGEVAKLLGVELPVYSERHLKLNFTDALNVIAGDAPMLIWDDAQTIAWDEDERAALAADPETRWLTESFPAGVHTRPDGPPGSPIRLMLWDYHRHPVEPVVPIELDELFPELVVRGLTTMIPGLRAYLGRMSKPYVDGGYYTKTKENRPLIGPLPVRGAYVIGAFSGYGLMAAPAAGELLAAHIVGEPLPDFAPAFRLERYADSVYLKLLEEAGTGGQL